MWFGSMGFVFSASSLDQCFIPNSFGISNGKRARAHTSKNGTVLLRPDTSSIASRYHFQWQPCALKRCRSSTKKNKLQNCCLALRTKQRCKLPRQPSGKGAPDAVQKNSCVGGSPGCNVALSHYIAHRPGSRQHGSFLPFNAGQVAQQSRIGSDSVQESSWKKDTQKKRF